MARATHIPITPSVLRWAIDESGFSDPEFAAKIKVEPNVVALALELRDEGHAVVVVTHDVKDRMPRKQSIKTACDHFGIEVMDLNQFRAAIAPDSQDPTQSGLPSPQESD